LYSNASSVPAKPNILKLRLKDSSDEAYHRSELQRILKEGGTLVLDLRGADPKLIKEWNSLYDFDAAGKGVLAISNDLVIIALADRDAEAPPESVTSRSAKFYDQQSKAIQVDPLEALKIEAAPGAALRINLYHDADPKTWRHELLGSAKKPGALIDAMKRGLVLELQNSPLDEGTRGAAYDPELANLIRQVVLEGRIMNNGSWVYAATNFKLVLTRSEVSAPTNFTLHAENEREHTDTGAGRFSTFYVNRHTIGMLFSRTVINTESGKLARKTGLLDIVPQGEGAAPIKFVITEELPVGKWNKLLAHPVFHDDSRAKPIIAVRSGVSVPNKFRELRSEGLKDKSRSRNSTANTPEATPLDQISQAIASESRVLLVRGDLDLAQAEVKDALRDKHPTYLQVTPYRTDEELWESVQIKEIEGVRKIDPKASEALKQLQKTDGVVVLSGIDSRRDLFKEQPGLLAKEPYLLVHGKGVGIVGKLILIERAAVGKAEAKLLNSELIERHLTSDKALLEKLKRFESALKSIPPHLGTADKELYPEAPRTNLNKLKLFLAEHQKQRDWAKAADVVFGGDYGQHPEARAFISVQAKRIFDNTDTAATAAISAQIVTAVQNSSGELAESSSHMWRLLDAFNGAALAKVGVSEIFTARLSDHQSAWSEIRRSLYTHSQGEFKEMYKQRFGFGDIAPESVIDITATPDSSPSPWTQMRDTVIERVINTWRKIRGLLYALPKGESNKIGSEFLHDDPSPESVIDITSTPDSSLSPWTQMRDTVIDLLIREGTRPQVLFLQGAPGRGKSHLIRGIRGELGDHRSMFGPITANPDMVFKSEELDKLLQAWRASTGGVLLIDEGNLLPKHFWDRLREDLLADPSKSVVFSGNETSQSGREPIALAEELGVTLFFEQFSQDEKASMISRYTKGIEHSQEIVEVILELTNFLENNQFGKSFTPRDLQEVCDWARFFGSTKEEVIEHIWRVYSPVFTREQQESLNVFIELRYGFFPVNAVDWAKAKFSQAYKESMLHNGFVLRDESLGVATELSQIVELSRKRGECGVAEGGKRGVIIEAESGWGKDFTSVKTLEAMGFKRGSITDPKVDDIPKSGAKRYYVINAELDFTTLQDTINRAAKEGAVLIIREANALDAGILEAKVNDILTGNVTGVHPAFLIVMTVNSSDVESMSAFSSALLSRVHHIKARLHSRETLQDMVAIAEPNLDPKIISKITGLHLYLRDVVGDGGRRPNTRDLLRAASEAVKGGDNWQKLAVDSYLFYIDNGLKGNQATADCLRFLNAMAEGYVPRSDVVPARVMKSLAQVVLPGYIGEIKVIIDPGCVAKNAGAYFKERSGSERAHTIAISPLVIEDGSWARCVAHEARHALNDSGGGSSSVFYGNLEQDIRDLRNQASFADTFPGSRLMELTREEQSLLGKIKGKTARLASERDFRLLMAVIAKTGDEAFTKKDLAQVAISSNNPVLKIALKHFDIIREISSCFAKKNFGGDFPPRAELLAKQVRLSEIVAEIFKDYNELPQHEHNNTGLTSFGSVYQFDREQVLRALENRLNLPPGSLAGPESVTHSSGAGSTTSSDAVIVLEEPLAKTKRSQAPELNEEIKRIIKEVNTRALQADSTPWRCPKELWEEVVSEWSETSVSNGRRSDPSGVLQVEEVFSGVRVEDARVSPGASVDRERKVIRIVGLSSLLSQEELGLLSELFTLGFTVALGDGEPVASCLGVCIEERIGRGELTKDEVERNLSPAERRCSVVLSMDELKVHLEAVSAYAAIKSGVELLEKRQAGGDVSYLAKRIVWPDLKDAVRTNEL
jgi:hypothetical protein